MKKTLLLLTLIFASIGFTQPQLEWYAVNDTLSPVDIAIDSDGNVIIAGNFVTAKYDANGELVWNKVYTPQWAGNNVIRALAVDNNGNAIISGTIEGEFTGRDYFTAKYGSNGSLAWVRTYYWASWNHERDEAFDLVADDAGRVYVTGGSRGEIGQNEEDLCTISYSSYGDTSWIIRTDLGQFPSFTSEDRGRAITLNSFDNPVVTGDASWDYYTVNFGDVLVHSYGGNGWTRTYGDTLHTEEGVDIAVDGDDNIFVAAKSSDYWVPDDLDADFLCLKYTVNGVFQWARYYNGSSDSMDVPVAITTDQNGNVYITGFSYNDSTYFDWCTIKYNADGDEQWVNIYNRHAHHLEKPAGIVVDDDGNTYVCGTTYSNFSGLDVTIVKYDTNGNEVWVEHFSRPGYTQDFAVSFCMDESGNMYFTSRNEDWGAVTGKYSQVTGINEPGLSALPTEFSLSQNYPNPFNPSTKISWQLPVGSWQTLRIYDVLGNEVVTLVDEYKPAGEYELQFEGNGLTSGIYFYQLRAGEFIQTMKMILIK